MATLIRGDSAYFRIPITHPETGGPYDLANCTVWVTMKQSPSSADNISIYMQHIQLDGDGEVVSALGLTLESTADTGVVIQRIAPQQSRNFRPGKYLVDVQVRDANGDVWTPIENAEESVVADITHAIAMV